MKDLDKLKQIFLTEVDEETLLENQELIRAWEKDLIESESFASWQDHDITLNIARQVKVSYVDISLMLARNRDLTERQRYELWGKQDACLFILSLIEKDAKGKIQSIQNEIKKALNATNTG